MPSLFIISAPSGAGKTTLRQALIARRKGLAYSVSFTTRAPRAGEVNGRDYHFVSPGEFEAMAVSGGFLEHAEVFGNRYGTARRAVEDQLAQGLDVLVDIDVQGARQIKRNWPGAVLIFIAPPSLAELEKRLRGRATENQDAIERRLAQAAGEIEAGREYDYLVINEDIGQAVEDLVAIVRARGLLVSQRQDFWNGLARS